MLLTLMKAPEADKGINIVIKKIRTVHKRGWGAPLDALRPPGRILESAYAISLGRR